MFEQGLSKQSKVVLRSGRVQHGSTWFNMVQRHFAPSSLPEFLSLSVTEAQCTGGVDAANGQSEARKHPRSSIFS